MKLSKTILTVLALGVCSLTFGLSDGRSNASFASGSSSMARTFPEGVSSVGVHGPKWQGTTGATMGASTAIVPEKGTNFDIGTVIATGYPNDTLVDASGSRIVSGRQSGMMGRGGQQTQPTNSGSFTYAQPANTGNVVNWQPGYGNSGGNAFNLRMK